MLGNGRASWVVLHQRRQHILISNGEIKNANDMGVLAGYQSGTSNIEVANMDIHNNGQASRITSENGHCCYGIYAEGTDFSVHHSKIHDNPGYGIHINCSGCGSSIA